MDKEYTDLEIFQEFSELSKELRASIKDMDRYYRFDVGDELRRSLREIKYVISDINRLPNTCKLTPLMRLCTLLDHLEIALYDCLEENSLSLKGRFSINSPLSRLERVKTQAKNWKAYIEDKYPQEVCISYPNISQT